MRARDRPIVGYKALRTGGVYPSTIGIYGPKVMVTNERAGSGGDHLANLFRRRGLGKIVGTRTWGGVVGIGAEPVLMDGGRVTVPAAANFSPDGRWEVENEGVSPDIEVEMIPGLVIDGHDPQLEKAIELVLEQLERSSVKRQNQPPAFPDRAGS